MTAAELQALVEPLWEKRPDLEMPTVHWSQWNHMKDDERMYMLVGWLVSRLPLWELVRLLGNVEAKPFAALSAPADGETKEARRG